MWKRDSMRPPMELPATVVQHDRKSTQVDVEGKYMPNPYSGLLKEQMLRRLPDGKLEVHEGSGDWWKIVRKGEKEGEVVLDENHPVLTEGGTHERWVKVLHLDAEGHSTDTVSEKKKQIFPNGKKLEHEFEILRDDQGRVKSEDYVRRDGDGNNVLEVHTKYRYDELGNPVSKTVEISKNGEPAQIQEVPFQSWALDHMTEANEHMDDEISWRSFVRQWKDRGADALRSCIAAIEAQEAIDTKKR